MIPGSRPPVAECGCYSLNGMNLGFTSGIALMGVLMASGYRAHTGHAMAGTGAPVSPAGFAAATHDAYLVMAGVAAVATLLAVVQERKAPRAG